jgi:hypothetical protein
MKRLGLFCIALLALTVLVAPARAQDGPLVAKAGEVFVVPEQLRGSPLLLKRGATFAVTLDDKLRMASFRGYAPDAEKTVPLGALLFSVSKDEGGTMLTVQSRLDQTVIYGVALAKGEVRSQRRSATICPVRPGLTVIESWPEEYDAVGLMKFEAIKDGGDMSCRDILAK